MARVYNFSAGPSMLPEEVLKTAQAELLEYGSSGQSVMEMSHRSPVFDAIFQETKAAVRRVLNVPEEYEIGFFQGGATATSPTWLPKRPPNSVMWPSLPAAKTRTLPTFPP